MAVKAARKKTQKPTAGSKTLSYKTFLPPRAPDPSTLAHELDEVEPPEEDAAAAALGVPALALQQSRHLVL